MIRGRHVMTGRASMMAIAHPLAMYNPGTIGNDIPESMLTDA